MWKPMLPTLVEEINKQKDWIYEIKYDGFRCGIEWTAEKITLWSRNGKDLTFQFPEIVSTCLILQKNIEKQLPIFLDGELVILRTPYQANFSSIQTRGRTRSKVKIQQLSKQRPVSFLCFDLLLLNDQTLQSQTLLDRRKQLEQLFKQFTVEQRQLLLIHSFKKLNEIEEISFFHQAEGIVAKNIHSTYIEGKRTRQWIKWKNYRTVQGVISGWNLTNDYFDVKLDKNEELGKIKHGFAQEDKKTLTNFIQANGRKQGTHWYVTPSVCIDINCLDVKDGEIREPVFRSFRFDLSPTDCTEEMVRLGLAQLPKEIDLTKPNKELFPRITKLDYLVYLRNVAPFLLPRLQNKRLTMIRYPDGIDQHSFYQKHLPDYAPEFIDYILSEDGEKDLLCNTLESLLWFGNHGGLEFHIPFQTVHSAYPDEMVFDLDPPSLEYFSYAVMAAHLIKDMVEGEGFTPLIKTSGRTGLQIHLPLREKMMTFEETRDFMRAVAEVLVQQYPDCFTIERLKKKRKNRLYIDYVQHAEGKTIIAPYSTRATKEATVATPLFWEEVDEKLDPRDYTVNTVPERLVKKGCPFLMSPPGKMD